MATLEDIFLAAVEKAPADRAVYLDAACGSDAALRAQVEALLRSHEEAGSLLEQPLFRPGPTVDEPTAAAQPGVVIGPYKLLQQIGEGGMGTVWMAQQTEPVKRLVAVKLIKAGMDSKQVIARFEAERQALALMDHANIARVLDAGTTSAGRPYFVMDLVKGVPITLYCDEHHLTPRQRLELFIPVCQAVQHAHQKGVIHRDLKPSNVLVALYDGKPVPKVIDFGVAKAAGQPLTDKTLVTGFGNIVGTLEYISPEQAEINQLDIDTRSDIYSLGVLLYELLAGSPPFTRKDLEKAGMLEMLRVIREQEPSKPSTKLSTAEGLPTLAANRGTEPAKLTKLVRGELDWIVMKALEKDRNRRYETANGFAMDVQRYLADEPVLACPPSAGYRMRKFARRNKVGLAMASLVLLFLVLLGSGIGWAVRDRSAREAEAARQQAARQGKVAGQVESNFGEVDRLEAGQKWPEALAAARRAEAAVSGGEADAETTERVRQRLKDLEFIDRLERIRMENEDTGGGTVIRAERDYAQVFRDYGVDVDELAVESSIERLKGRPALAIPLAVALDRWASVRRAVASGDAAGWKRLVAIARGIDPEPLRDRLRSTSGQPLTLEAQDELRRLAESIDVRAHHPTTLSSLAGTLGQAGFRDAGLRVLREAQAIYPGDFWLNWQLSSALYHQGDLDGAIRFKTAAVSVRPSAILVYWELGQSLRQQGKSNEAIAIFRRAIEINPKHHQAPYYDLGNTLRDQGKPDEAIVAYRKGMDAVPVFASTYRLAIGNTLRAQGKPDEAIAAFRHAIEADPEHADNYLHWIGDTLRDQKKPAEAIAAYRKATELKPNAPYHHRSLGLALRDQKKLVEANAAFDKAIELYRKAPDPNSARVYWDLGVVLRDKGELDEAITTFRKALDIDPKDGAVIRDLVNALRARGRPVEVIAVYRRAIEADPNSFDLHRGLGAALVERGKLDEAVAVYRKAVELARTSNFAAGGDFSLGEALHRQKKMPEAIAAYHRAIELDPKNHGAAAYIYLGNLLRDWEKLDEAVAAYRKSIEINDPRNLVAAHVCLGDVLSQQSKPDEAIGVYRKVIELQPNSPVTHSKIAWILATRSEATLRDPKQAKALARRAVEIDPNSGLAWQYLGWIHYRTGDWKASIEALEKSCKQDKGTGDAGQWLVLALAHARLAAQEGLPDKECERHKVEARRWFDQADKQIDSWWRGRPVDVIGQAIWDFRSEARQLMGTNDSKK